ncbi:hypothetical protein [Tissierella sp.]|uniref:hypothetical protein n=1 Tax=Tissierella sp. TaxID=41274 RepID=UPI0030719F94
MKLKKTKKFNTVESYAACICIATTCSCSCNCNSGSDFSSTSSGKAQGAFNNSHYDANNSAVRG